MFNLRLRPSDISIFIGLVALLVFCHMAISDRPASAGVVNPLLMQGAGSSYFGLEINERATELEINARNKLYELGSAQLAYSRSTHSGNFAHFQELISNGYIQPNMTGRTLTSDYSISFFFPERKRGFTLIAQPMKIDLRAFMITENMEVILMTPSIDSDPNESWATVRAMESELKSTEGRFSFLKGFQLLEYEPPLQIRLDADRKEFVLVSFDSDEYGLKLDDTMVFSSSMSDYLIGDTR